MFRAHARWRRASLSLRVPPGVRPGLPAGDGRTNDTV